MTDPDLPDGPPPLLYKFLGVGSGLSPPWTERLDALLEGMCFHPGAAAFNDPFDCWPYGALPGSKAGFEAAQAPFIATLAENERRDIPADYAIQWMTKKFAGKSIEDIHDGVQRGLRMAADATGVFCLAACIESTLMWSHYGSSHAGLALRFDFRRQRRGGLNPLWKVRYEEERPVLDTLQMGKLGDVVPRALATKSDAWAYEQEWRSMKPEGAGQVFKFDPEVITGVIFGANCRPEDEAWVRDRVRPLGLSLERMRPDPRSFALVRGPA